MLVEPIWITILAHVCFKYVGLWQKPLSPVNQLRYIDNLIDYNESYQTIDNDQFGSQSLCTVCLLIIVFARVILVDGNQSLNLQYMV